MLTRGVTGVGKKWVHIFYLTVEMAVFLTADVSVEHGFLIWNQTNYNNSCVVKCSEVHLFVEAIKHQLQDGT